jgi:hypothetical protein
MRTRNPIHRVAHWAREVGNSEKLPNCQRNIHACMNLERICNLKCQVRTFGDCWREKHPHLLDRFFDLYFGIQAYICLNRRIGENKIHESNYRTIIADLFEISRDMMIVGWNAAYSCRPISLLLTDLFPWDEGGIPKSVMP